MTSVQYKTITIDLRNFVYYKQAINDYYIVKDVDGNIHNITNDDFYKLSNKSIDYKMGILNYYKIEFSILDKNYNYTLEKEHMTIKKEQLNKILLLIN